MTSDNPDRDAIKGDVIPERIRRVSGKRGSDKGLIEIPLVGHRYRYRVRVELGSGAPRLVELHLIADSTTGSRDAEIDPATVRQVPVRRLAKAAARYISLTELGIAVAGDFDDPTNLLRPDRPTNGGKRRKLDDVHYRQVAKLLTAAREIGLPPRQYVAERLGGSLPTVDRWITEAKRRKFLPRDWARAADTATAAEGTGQ